jgi:hypothetical protein
VAGVTAPERIVRSNSRSPLFGPGAR